MSCLLSLFFYVVALWHHGALHTFSLSLSLPFFFPFSPCSHLEPPCSDVSCECHGKAAELGKTKMKLWGGGFSAFPPALHPPPAFSSPLSCIPTSSGKRLLLKLKPVTWTCLFGLCRFPGFASRRAHTPRALWFLLSVDDPG